MVTSIQNHKGLVHLNVGQNGLLNEGLEEVFRAVASSESLVSLNIQNTQVQNKNKFVNSDYESYVDESRESHYKQSLKAFTFMLLKNTKM